MASEMIQRLAEHSVRVDLLPEAPTVLDVGARGFDFTRAVLAIRPRAQISALDPSPDVEPPDDLDCDFGNLALTGEKRPQAMLRYEEEPSAAPGNHLVKDDLYAISKGCIQVICVQIGRMYVKYWDLVKLDCEGSEFDILRHWPGPIASQISVEFHDALPRCAGEDLPALVEHLAGLGYVAVQHEATAQEPGVGHWDSLFVLKSLL